jgi:lysophospholipase L1-like esterase
MAELAKVHGIKVVLCSVLPASRFYWNESVRPSNEILELNRKIRAYAQRNNLVYVDYHSKMVGADKGLPIDYSTDGVHPNKSGYELMQALVLPVLSELMKGDAP